MGSLALAVAGGVGGAGAGVADVARQKQIQDREATLMRLRAQEEAKNQQAAQAQRLTGEQSLQQSSQQFEHAEHERGYQVGAAAAGAQRELQQTLKMLEVQGRHKDVEDLVAGRVTVQQLKNQGAANTAAVRKPSPPDFVPAKGKLNSPGVDAYDPNHAPLPGREVDIQQHRDGSRWIQGPLGELYPFDPSQPNGYADPKSFRHPAAADTQALLRNPLGAMPSGLPVRDYYVQKFGRLPAGYLGAVAAARARIDASQPSAPRAGSAPATSPPQTTAPNAEPSGQDAQEENEDNNVALGGSPGGGAPPSGDESPQ